MAGGSPSNSPPTQSAIVTAIFAFNLIIGVGALSLPFSMNLVGIAVGCVLIVLVGVLGYISATFVLESIANSSALLRLGRASGSNEQLSEHSTLTTELPITSDMKDSELFEFRHLELSKMSDMLFPKWGRVGFYFVICIYLYGDLAIYGVAVPLTLSDFFGWDYRWFLTIFAAFMVPFVFFNFQKTKFLQIATLTTRNVALLSMIILTIRFIGQGNGDSNVRWARPQGIATAFGNIVYAFMCHHSLPSIVAPMKNKQFANKSLLFTFLFVGMIYLIFPVTAIFAFADIENTKCASHSGPPCRLQRLFTQNFSSFDLRWMASFLSLFPVFTLSSNFPLISITLRNNLLTLFKQLNLLTWNTKLQYIVCCLLSPLPPLAVVYIVRDVSVLVGFTGAYAGVFIMFIVPACLVYRSRNQLKKELGRALPSHDLTSPFQHVAWVVVILIWSCVSLVIITVNNVMHYA